MLRRNRQELRIRRNTNHRWTTEESEGQIQEPTLSITETQVEEVIRKIRSRPGKDNINVKLLKYQGNKTHKNYGETTLLTSEEQ